VESKETSCAPFSGIGELGPLPLRPGNQYRLGSQSYAPFPLTSFRLGRKLRCRQSWSPSQHKPSETRLLSTAAPWGNCQGGPLGLVSFASLSGSFVQPLAPGIHCWSLSQPDVRRLPAQILPRGTGGDSSALRAAIVNLCMPCWTPKALMS